MGPSSAFSSRAPSMAKFSDTAKAAAVLSIHRSRSCPEMIITDANEFVGELHDRMPVMLEPEQLEAWLTGRSRPRNLKPAPTCCNAGRCHGA
jgi:putative SOS response-associated peptidase YedK